MARPGRPERNRAARSFRQLRRFHHVINSNKVFGTHTQQYIAQGYGWVIDFDLEKFFDRVNHDKLMGQIAKRVEDKRLLKLIRAFLNAGVMENGLISLSVEGTPQGGPLSPLLSNLVLYELDRELECRGHRFVRYADDCNIYVRSERAGQRVMESISRFITQKLRLKVNEAKSAVARPQERKFLGFSFMAGPDIKRTIAPKSLDRFKQRIRDITRRAKGVSIKATMEEQSLRLKPELIVNSASPSDVENEWCSARRWTIPLSFSKLLEETAAAAAAARLFCCWERRISSQSMDIRFMSEWGVLSAAPIDASADPGRARPMQRPRRRRGRSPDRTGPLPRCERCPRSTAA